MYCYKNNNSNTIYVFNEYINDCIKASKEFKETYYYKETVRTIKHNKPIPKKEVIAPLPSRTILFHSAWGNGRVVSTDDKGIMEVAFRNKTARFLYPDAIKNGFLVLA